MSDIQVWAHRGASGYAPENTLEAFRLAIEMGADGIELDVQLTADGELVVIHDETLQRVSDAHGYVKDYTLAQLKALNVNKNFPKYGNVAIPTLQEVLDLLSQTKLMLNIELKTGNIFYHGIEEKVIALIDSYGMQDRVWYSSFNHYSVKKVKDISPQAQAGILCGNCIYEPAKYARYMGVEAVHPNILHLKYPGYAQECRKSGIKLHTWTANAYVDLELCVSENVDALITNYPDKAKIMVNKQADGRFPCENPFISDKRRKFALFGAGGVGLDFIKRYAGKYVPDVIFDNSQEKWGTGIEGILVENPKCIREIDCVVIASLYYAEIVPQLKQLGINNYYIYDETCSWD